MTGWDPLTMTRSVEVLHITDTDSHWSVVEQLPHVTYVTVPLIVSNNLYSAAGYGKDYESKCDMMTASLPQLLHRVVTATLAVVKCGTNYLTCLTPHHLSTTAV